MDMKDVYGVGNDILDAVNQAVSKGDFTGLNEKIEKTMRDVTGAAAGTAADALHDFQGFVQGTPGQGGNAGPGMSGSAGSAGTSGANASGGPGGRTYGHAGRATGNVTEEYMKRAAGARHHTQFTSKISPFLQRRISRGSGTGKIVGGIICLVVAGFTFLDGLFASLVGLFSFGGGNILTAAGITSLVFTLGLAVLGGVLIKKGNERKKLVRDYYEYGRIAGTAEYLEIEKLARATGQSRETVLANLEKMISEEMLPAAWFDRQKTTLMLSERMYNEYLRLERERQEEEAEKAKQEMEKRAAGAYGFGAAGAAGGSSAGTAGIDEDLRPLPEDARLPADARKIVEEGLLYISRIRSFNREIEDEEISAQLAQLEITMKRILDQIRKDPSSAPNLRRLMVYYLPTTMKLLEAYGELDRQPFAGENIASTKKEIRDALGTINHAFENLLDSLFQDMAWDISSDISVMKTMMAQDGLTGDQMRKAAARAAAGQNGQTVGQMQDVIQDAAAQPAGGPQQAAGGLQTEAFDGYTDGYTEDPAAAEGGLAAQVQAEQKEQAEGIRLKFGE